MRTTLRRRTPREVSVWTAVRDGDRILVSAGALGSPYVTEIHRLTPDDDSASVLAALAAPRLEQGYEPLDPDACPSLWIEYPAAEHARRVAAEEEVTRALDLTSGGYWAGAGVGLGRSDASFVVFDGPLARATAARALRRAGLLEGAVLRLLPAGGDRPAPRRQGRSGGRRR